MNFTFDIFVIIILGFNGIYNLYIQNEVVGLLWCILATLYTIMTRQNVVCTKELGGAK